jgi:hypothetical protein
MTALRKNGNVREKELRLAISRIERGRSQTKGAKLSISAVAREVGISSALIHNHYPLIAEEIRSKQGASSRQQRDAKQSELQHEREKNKFLRQERDELRGQIARLVSINEMLLHETKVLQAKIADPKVTDIGIKGVGKPD